MKNMVKEQNCCPFESTLGDVWQGHQDVIVFAQTFCIIIYIIWYILEVAKLLLSLLQHLFDNLQLWNVTTLQYLDMNGWNQFTSKASQLWLAVQISTLPIGRQLLLWRTRKSLLNSVRTLDWLCLWIKRKADTLQNIKNKNWKLSQKIIWKSMECATGLAAPTADILTARWSAGGMARRKV